MKTKNSISGYIIRSAAYAVFFSVAVIALESPMIVGLQVSSPDDINASYTLYGAQRFVI